MANSITVRLAKPLAVQQADLVGAGNRCRGFGQKTRLLDQAQWGPTAMSAPVLHWGITHSAKTGARSGLVREIILAAVAATQALAVRIAP